MTNPSRGVDAAFDWARRHVEGERLPHAVLGVTSADGILALDAFGTVHGRAVDVDDSYRLFSITKALVGLTAARAVERGLLTPDTPLVSALPGFGAGRDDVVRLRHLASHTSGVTETPLDTPDLRSALLRAGRDFVAGTTWRYSSLAFEGIAAMLEHTTGQTWDAGVHEWAQAIGADGLTLDEAADPLPIVDLEGTGFDLARFVQARHPGAGLIGRARDLLAIGSSLLRGDEIVRRSTLAMMRRPLTEGILPVDRSLVERGQEWGFTWNLRTRAPGLIDRNAFGHGGWAGTQLWVHPDAGVAWVLLTARTQSEADIDELDNAIVSAV